MMKPLVTRYTVSAVIIILIQPGLWGQENLTNIDSQRYRLRNQSILATSRYTNSTRNSHPYFIPIGRPNITCSIGDTVRFECRVKHLGDRTVSWIRKRDLHVLTSNIFTFTGDDRFSVFHPPKSDDWILEIKYVQQRDAGVYECQVNTQPKINFKRLLIIKDLLSLQPEKLNASEPEILGVAKISGPKEVYVKPGSMISLTCTLQNLPTQKLSSTMIWYHDAVRVDFSSPRGGISIETEKTDNTITSNLVLSNAMSSDSGNYTCVPSNSKVSSVWIHVLHGDKPAAMHGSSLSISKNRRLIYFLISQIICFILNISSNISY